MQILNGIKGSEKDQLFPNLFYSPELEETFIYILCRIPLWSNIMVKTFNSTNYTASSSVAESSFKCFKYDYGKKNISTS